MAQHAIDVLGSVRDLLTPHLRWRTLSHRRPGGNSFGCSRSMGHAPDLRDCARIRTADTYHLEENTSRIFFVPLALRTSGGVPFELRHSFEFCAGGTKHLVTNSVR